MLTYSEHLVPCAPNYQDRKPEYFQIYPGKIPWSSWSFYENDSVLISEKKYLTPEAMVGQ